MKPCGFDIQFKYKCPRCNLEYWLSQQEARTKGFKVVCCNTSFTIEAIKNIKVNLEFYRDKTDIITNSYHTLKSLGFSFDKIKAFQESVNAKSSEELTKMFLKAQ